MPDCNRKNLNCKVNNNLSPGQELVLASCCSANKSHFSRDKFLQWMTKYLSLIDLSPFFGLATSKLTVKLGDVSACAEIPTLMILLETQTKQHSQRWLQVSKKNVFKDQGCLWLMFCFRPNTNNTYHMY